MGRRWLPLRVIVAVAGLTAYGVLWWWSWSATSSLWHYMWSQPDLGPLLFVVPVLLLALLFLLLTFGWYAPISSAVLLIFTGALGRRRPPAAAPSDGAVGSLIEMFGVNTPAAGGDAGDAGARLAGAQGCAASQPGSRAPSSDLADACVPATCPEPPPTRGPT